MAARLSNISDKVKTLVYVLLAVAAISTVLFSLLNVKNSTFDYKKCLQSAEAAIDYDFLLDANTQAVTPLRQSQYMETMVDIKFRCKEIEAQWSMRNMAFLGFGIGFWGLIFLILTAFEAKGVAKSATQTLIEAKNTTLITREIGVTQTRAYLGIERFEWDKNATMDGFVIRPAVRNFGHSFAEEVVSYTNKAIIEEGSLNIDFNANDVGNFQYSGIVAPQNSDRGLAAEFFFEEFSQQVLGKCAVYIYGFIEYTSQNTRYITRFCERLYYTNQTPESGRISQHNCTDNSCDALYGKPKNYKERRQTGNWVS